MGSRDVVSSITTSNNIQEAHVQFPSPKILVFRVEITHHNNMLSLAHTLFKEAFEIIAKELTGTGDIFWDTEGIGIW